MAVKRVIGTPDGPVYPDGEPRARDSLRVWCDHGDLTVQEVDADLGQALLRCAYCRLEWWEESTKLEKREEG